MPNRGEILDFNRQVPLSRPLFDGFGSINVDSTTKPTIENKKAIAVGSASDSSTQSNVVMERLPNGWSKKAVKRLSGTSKGNKNIVIHKYNFGSHSHSLQRRYLFKDHGWGERNFPLCLHTPY